MIFKLAVFLSVAVALLLHSQSLLASASESIGVALPAQTSHKSIPADSSRAQTYWILEEKYRDAEDFPKAIEAYKKVIALAGDSAVAGDAHHGIGWIYIQQKDFRSAVSELQQAVRLKTGDADPFLDFGMALLMLGQNPLAIENFQKAISLRPNFADAYYNLGLAYDLMGDKADAIIVYRKLKAIDPKLAQALLDQLKPPK